MNIFNNLNKQKMIKKQKEFENDNILKLNIIKDNSPISKEELIKENDSQKCVNNMEKKIIKDFLLNENSNHLSNKLKYLYIIELLSKYKMKSKYNCTVEMYNKIITGFLLENAVCHIVAIFKDKMLSDYMEEFLRREYNLKECNHRVPKFSKYYRNYARFFCKPIFRDFRLNKIINKNGEKKAEVYYKNNYQGGITKDDDENNGFEKSSSSEEDMNKKNKNNKKDNILDLKNLEMLFDESVKQKIENATIMTSLNSSTNTINLKLNNEKIEVFSENKCDKSNETTLYDIMDIIKNKKEYKIINVDKLKKEIIQQTDNNNSKNIILIFFN